MKENDGGGLSEFLDEIALYTDIEQHDKDTDSAVMMTMHSAKGLEFPTVFLVGAEEGIFPGPRSVGEPDELEEERRLCYVAMTRAETKLYITAAKQRMLFGRTSANRVSRFVDEIPEELIEKAQNTKFRNFGGGYVKKKEAKVRSVAKMEQIPTTAILFEKGESVEHKAFGTGLVISVSPMGGDALLEIAFDGVGTKRLMKNSASQHMEKK